MPGKVKVKILAGRNLPVMDRSGDTTDAYVELKFGNVTYKTDVCRKTLNPQWNSEWYKFEVDDAELQDEPLQIRLMDYDTYSANDAIGKVYVNLNPLLLHGILPPVKNLWTLETTINASTGSQASVMTGWIPVYDTMHGIRGEVNIIIKVELFSDFNRFRESSCGVQFFYSPNIPYGYHAQMIHGFVEELVVSDDPEYKWIDKIRTPRASNEARQILFFKLSGEVQRKIGLKALDLGGNAVIGYLQNFDLEGESGIVARGIGTVVTLVKLHDVGFPCDNVNIEEITFVSSQTKTQMEHVDSGDSASFIPVLVPTRVPASNPIRVPLNRNCPFYLRTSSSLTRLEPTTKVSGISGYPRTQKHVKQIQFFRSKSSNLNFSTATDLNLVLSKFSINEIEKSLRGMSKDLRMQSSRDRLAKQIKHFRSKFYCVEENNSTTKSDGDFDVDSIRSFTIDTRNSKQNKDFKDTNNKTQGKIMTALLIGSIRNMLLDDVMNIDRISVNCSNEQSSDEINCHSKENIENNDKNQEKLQNGSSLMDDKQIFSFDDDNSTHHDLLDDSTNKCNILNNSRYSLDKDCDNNSKDSASTCSKTDSQTESTLQFDLNVTSQSSSDTSLTSTSDVGTEKNDLHNITYSDTSIDASELSINENQPNDLLSNNSSFVNLPEIDSSNLKSIHSSVDSEQGTDYAGITSRRLSQMHRVHLSRHERDLCRIRSQTPSADFRSLLLETKICSNTDRQKDNPKTNSTLDSPSVTICSDTSYKEIYAIANAERQKRMRELIDLIDTKMMVSAFTCRDRKIVSSIRKCKKHRNRRNSQLKSSFCDMSTMKTDTSHKYPGKDTCSKHLSLIQHSSISSNAMSHSCNCSLSSLTDNHTRVSPSRKRNIVRFPMTDNQSVDVSNCKLSSKKSLPNSHSEPDTVVTISNDIHELVKTNNNLTSLSSDTAKTTILRRNSASSLKVFYHIDCAKPTNSANMTYNWCVSHPSPDLRQQDEASLSPSYPLPTVPSVAAKTSQSPAAKGLATVPVHRRSSDSDLSVTPKGNSLGGSDRSTTGALKTPAAAVRPMNQDTLEMLEYPFITMQHYPPGFILRIGGLVSSRSVKLLERISNLEEPESRDAWWIEIRMEVRSHARALACNVVIGYKEETSICDDVCVLSASGTAAVISFHNSTPDPDSIVLNKFQQTMPAPVDLDRDKNQQRLTKIDSDITNLTLSETRTERQSGKTPRHYSESNDHEESCNQLHLKCNLCHLPYSENNVPFRINVSKCAICKRANVPDVIFTTIEVPTNIPINGRGCFINAIVCKNKKDLRGELNAKEISDCLPFLEYELHSLLLNKLKVKGMNAIFGLKVQVSVGERLIIAMAVGTALYLTALPPPTIPKIASGNSWHKEDQLADIQKSIVETVKKNREFYRLKSTGISEVENGRTQGTSDTDDSDDDLPELDLASGIRDTCILEVDDIEDMDRVSLLIMDDRPPDDFHVVNTQAIPGLEDLEIVRNLQMFTQISRTKIPMGQFASMPSKYFTRLLQSLYFKLRRMVPCALCDMQFKIALAEQDEIQLSVIGMALGLGEPLKPEKLKKKVVSHSLSKDQLKKSDDSELIFSLDEDHVENNVASDNANRTCLGNLTNLSTIQNLVQKPRQRSPLRSRMFMNNRHKHVPLKGRYGVDITPLSYLPGGRIERYQGNLNFFFIRESTSIRENGGLSGFTHSFVMEVLAIVRAHITALGGNAMVAFFMTQCVLFHNPHKNQGQCLINVGGDVVTVSYYADEKHNVSNC